MVNELQLEKAILKNEHESSSEREKEARGAGVPPVCV